MNNLIYLLKLGAHLGSSISEYNYSSSLNQFLLGSRYNYYIFNLKYSLYLLKRSISFLTNLGFHNSHLFFFFSHNISWIENFVFFLIKKNKHSFSHNIWIGGTITNFKFCFLKFFLFIINKQLHFRLKKKKLFFSTLNRFSYLKNFKFFNFLFFKLLILNYNNFKNLNFNIVTFKKIFNKYWRFFFFFKNFSVILKKIDCCIIFNAKNNLIPIYEFSRRKIPTIGVIDTNTPYYLNITYPIVSNDDSILLLIFFTNIFLNSFNIGSINFFFFMIKKKKKNYFLNFLKYKNNKFKFKKMIKWTNKSIKINYFNRFVKRSKFIKINYFNRFVKKSKPNRFNKFKTFKKF